MDYSNRYNSIKNGTGHRISLSKRNLRMAPVFLIFYILFLTSCKTDKKIIKPDNGNKETHTTQILPLNREGWLRDDVFQVIESITINDSSNEEKIQRKILAKSHLRAAQLIAFSRYKILKDEMDIVKKLAKYLPFIQVMKGSIVKTEANNSRKRFVYRIQGPKLKRRLKRIMNFFEETNPRLRKKIRTDDFTY